MKYYLKTKSKETNIAYWGGGRENRDKNGNRLKNCVTALRMAYFYDSYEKAWSAMDCINHFDVCEISDADHFKLMLSESGKWNER